MWFVFSSDGGFTSKFLRICVLSVENSINTGCIGVVPSGPALGPT